MLFAQDDVLVRQIECEQFVVRDVEQGPDGREHQGRVRCRNDLELGFFSKRAEEAWKNRGLPLRMEVALHLVDEQCEGAAGGSVVRETYRRVIQTPNHSHVVQAAQISVQVEDAPSEAEWERHSDELARRLWHDSPAPLGGFTRLAVHIEPEVAAALVSEIARLLDLAVRYAGLEVTAGMTKDTA